VLTRTRNPRARRAYIDPFTPAEIRRLVAEFGSPLLIVDCQRIREQYRKLHRALPGVDLHYALKPLPHPAVVQTIVELGGWLDLATTGETQLVTQLGIDPARCIHTHPIKRDIDIRNSLHLGVKTFVADNPDEVRKFEAYRDRAELLLRVSFRSPGAVVDLSRKFGCDPEDLLELARLARPAAHKAGAVAKDAGAADGQLLPVRDLVEERRAGRVDQRDPAPHE
jgi:ornithine decarboxylase